MKLSRKHSCSNGATLLLQMQAEGGPLTLDSEYEEVSVTCAHTPLGPVITRTTNP